MTAAQAMTPGEHRSAAEVWIDRAAEDLNAGSAEGNYRDHDSAALRAIAHGVLALSPEPQPASITWAGFLSLLVICGTFLAAVWVVAQ